MTVPKCGECGSDMVLRTAKKIFTDRQLKNPRFWGCSKYPDCRGTHGAHPDGRPLGVPANKETKAWRIKAHDTFDTLWKCSQITMTRKKAYKLLAEKLGVTEVHIGESDIETCRKIISASDKILKELGGIK